MMQPDDELCLCFHVTRRKVENFLRQRSLKRASQLTECYGAGTGCGWCRPFLLRLFERDQQLRQQAIDTAAAQALVDKSMTAGDTLSDSASDELPSPAEYAKQRAKYVRAGGGTPPPGAAALPNDGE